ncbi:MAG TPA: MraY family glycosyltransferase [Candidatus Moranbacteria bacterium]|nr:MraY family glycosyltransferase [Candidatus Moranbacteria bacterium]HRZ33675.1 MraY family glycosyltransferase [Candidatus Moranbacteria bacterium]
MQFFLIPFIISFIISASFLVLFVLLNKKKNFNDVRTSDRHIHNHDISRFGGVALIISFIATLILNNALVITTPLKGILFASVFILIFGIIDDMIEISWKIQLFFQVAIIFFVYFMGVRLQYITNPFGGIFLFDGQLKYFIGFFIILAWMLIIINSMNWIDGIDGASSGITLIGGAAVFILSLRPEVNQPPIGIITASLVGGVLALMFFNFYPAKILAGTSGSLFMGFMLAVLAVFAGAKIATTLLIMAVPVIDAFWVIIERIRSKSSIFSADKRHLHFRLIELGWSQRKICFFYYAITVFIAILALNTRTVGKTATFILFVIAMLSMIILIKNKTSNKI